VRAVFCVQTGKTPEDVHAVVVIGGSSRIPVIKDKLMKVCDSSCQLLDCSVPPSVLSSAIILSCCTGVPVRP
jgi:hypothetical protein